MGSHSYERDYCHTHRSSAQFFFRVKKLSYFWPRHLPLLTWLLLLLSEHKSKSIELLFLLMIARPTCIFYNCLGFPLLLILDSQLVRCFPALQMKWGRNSLDSVFPISCNYLTIQPIQNIYMYCLKALLMRKTLKPTLSTGCQILTIFLVLAYIMYG